MITIDNALDRDGVSNLHYDGYRWVKYGSSDIHCRYLEEEDRTEYTPADDTDGMWVKIVYSDGRVDFSQRGASEPVSAQP